MQQFNKTIQRLDDWLSFQYCFSNQYERIYIIGQDGYIYGRGDNHFDKSYGYETANFDAANKRIISLHDVIREHARKNGIEIFNLTDKTIIKDHYPLVDIDHVKK